MNNRTKMYPTTLNCRQHIVTMCRISLIAILALVSFTASGATTRYVSPLGSHDTANGFDTWAGAANNIQDAVNVAVAGDTIYVTNATYQLTAPVTVTQGITLSGNETAVPPYAILDGQKTVRCLDVQHANAVVQGFIVSNGFVNAMQAGGGGYVKFATVTDCVFTGNFSTNAVATNGGRSLGGGLYVESGTVRNSLFVNNAAAGDGAGFYAKSSLVEDCVILSNRSVRIAAYAYGSGIDSDNSVIKRCQILYNKGALWGGGARANGSSALMDDCRIAGNSAIGGGGLFLTTSSRFFGGTITSNEALGASSLYGGGGVYVDSGIVSNTLISVNTAAYGYLTPPGSGGAGAMLKGSTARLTHCHVVSNKVSLSGIGGGIFLNEGVVANTLIEYNVASRGTTAHTLGQGVAMLKGTVTNCVIRYNRVPDGNQADWGGGVFMESGTLVGCQVVSNATGYLGGGIYMGLAVATAAPLAEVRNCVVIGNQVVQYNATYGDATGGGIYMASTNALVRNTLVANNGSTKTRYGGGIYLTNGVIESVTVTRNLAKDTGGGIYRTSAGQLQAVVNTIVWNNDALLSDDDIANPSDTVFAYSCSPALTPAVNGNLASDPRLASSGSSFGYLSSVDDYTPTSASPCIDVGQTLSWMAGTVDLKGLRRIRGGAPDMGAYEILLPWTILIVR